MKSLDKIKSKIRSKSFHNILCEHQITKKTLIIKNYCIRMWHDLEMHYNSDTYSRIEMITDEIRCLQTVLELQKKQEIKNDKLIITFKNSSKNKAGLKICINDPDTIKLIIDLIINHEEKNLFDYKIPFNNFKNLHPETLREIRTNRLKDLLHELSKSGKRPELQRLQHHINMFSSFLAENKVFSDESRIISKEKGNFIAEVIDYFNLKGGQSGDNDFRTITTHISNYRKQFSHTKHDNVDNTLPEFHVDK